MQQGEREGSRSGRRSAEALAASGVEPVLAKSLVRSQAACLVCGNGMLVLPWAEVVATADQVVLDAKPANVRVHIHGFCLTGVSAGELIAREVLGHSQLATTADICAHVLPKLQRHAADRMGTLLEAIGTAS